MDSMKKPFREHHILQIFNAYGMGSGPLDLFLRQYFRTHKAVGAKDRKAIAEAVYGIIRWQGLLDHLIGSEARWDKRLEYYLDFSPEKYLIDARIPLHARVSFPKDFFNLLVSRLGEEKAVEFCLTSNEPAPTTIRANTLKTTRKALLELWNPLYEVSACQHASTGITFHKKINFFGLDAFKDGLFEVQDEASQLVSELVAATPGDHVLDFCAGAGGKSLAIAPKMGHRGQLFVHDVRASILREAKKRLCRAGVQNAQILPSDAPHKIALRHRMDWVLVDVPCSGSGTLRRNPDIKWKWDEAGLTRLIEEQRAIFQEALAFLKPNGRIAYTTCSVLPEENENQAAFFEKTHGLMQVGKGFTSFPQKGGMDGFFGIVFAKK